MLIRMVSENDKPAWVDLAATVADLFNNPTMAQDLSFHDYMDRKITSHEALIGIDRMSGACIGIISFSRQKRRISWFAVNPEHRGKGAGKRLLDTALRQMDTNGEISVITFPRDNADGNTARAVYEKAGFTETENFRDEHGNKRSRMTRPRDHKNRGGSFHYNYDSYARMSQKEYCPPCSNQPMPDHMTDIAEMEYSFVTAERIAQGRLFGKCHVLIKNHHVNFEEIPHTEMAAFMGEVQKAGEALRKVTGAIKINYEIHSNSGPHIHCHLFPRYLDDDFPSAPIDYRITEPSPYESEEEFLWFIKRMREELGIISENPPTSFPFQH